MRAMTRGKRPVGIFATALAAAWLTVTDPWAAANEGPDYGGWATGAPREEIRPEFAYEPSDGQG